MKRTIVILTLVGALVLACSGMVLAQSTASGDQAASGGQSYTLPANVDRVCHKPTDPEKASCLALRRNDIGRGAHPKATFSYEGVTLRPICDPRITFRRAAQGRPSL